MSDSSSWRTTPLPRGWAKTRARILKRDRRTCTQCGLPGREVDHVIPAHQGGGDDDANLTTLCYDCHKAKSSSEGGQAYAALRARRWRPKEAHPSGL